MTRRLLHLQKATGYAGSEEFLVKLGRGLTGRGWECHIVVLKEDRHPVGRFKQSLSDAGWKTETVSMNWPITPSAVLETRRIIQTLEPDLINTHLIHADLLGVLAAAGLGIPLVSTKHNDDRFKHWTGYRLLAQGLNYPVDHVVTISDHLTRFYREELGLAEKPCTRIHYGLDPEEFHSNAESEKRLPEALGKDVVTFGMVARLTEQKGHEILIEAYEKISRLNPENQLVLVGDGPLREGLRKQVERADLEGSVHFLGHRSDVPRLLKHFDVFVHPSRWEGFGLVFLEAMAAELPVVATTVSAIPEIVQDGRTGFLVEPDNSRQLQDALRTLLRSPERRDGMGQAGRRRLESSFTVEHMIDQYENLYETVINRASTGLSRD